jgi:hypothetical protein
MFGLLSSLFSDRAMLALFYTHCLDVAGAQHFGKNTENKSQV